jgi:hypothetical protein
MAFAGNLAAVLFAPKKRKQVPHKIDQKSRGKIRYNQRG